MTSRDLPLLCLVLACACAPEPGDENGADEATETRASGDGDGDGDGDENSGDGDGDGDGDSGDGDGDSNSGDGDGDGDGDGEPDPRTIVLETYAPRVWFPSDEAYWPSTVEFAWPHLQRLPDGEGQYWLHTITPLDSPSDTLPFFSGDLDGAVVYGYFADKGDEVVDLVYWMHYPYQRGKSVVDTIWGNHVGDWEHITVRLSGNLVDGFSPTQVYLAAHSFGFAYDWGGGEIEIHDETHPVIYSAWGSHGSWSTAGEHVYMTIGEVDPFFDICITLVCEELTDVTEAGVAWDTWDHVVPFDYFAQERLDGGEWPVWMSDQFDDPGAGDPTVPGMGPIFRWGNPEDCSVLGIPFDITDLIGICRLEDGPTGPISKNTWGPELN